MQYSNDGRYLGGTFDSDGDGVVDVVSRAYHDEKGRLVRTERLQDGEIESIRILEYDDSDRVVRETYFDSYGPEPSYVYEYEYDDAGYLVVERTKPRWGSFVPSEMVYSWEDGFLRQRVYYIKPGELASTYRYEYDDSGRLVRMTNTEADGSWRWIETFTYDDKGWLIFEHTEQRDRVEWMSWKHDRIGRPTEKIVAAHYLPYVVVYENYCPYEE